MTDIVTEVDTGPRRVSRRALVNAPAAELFALVADPHRHPELDGSGTVRREAVEGPHQLSEGARFTVPMRQFGMPYKITSVVTAFAQDRLIEWRHPLGHRWRWEFAAQTPGRTEVTETFDYSTSRAPWMAPLLGFPAQNAKGITATLAALVARYPDA
ncbi:SRPBCC family protein [Catenuloplanes japonicus]|uniref:SRPBCC family protein n=1 Tax=Catenuloplanes japonicus TaxID=33876 RepID=UPI000524515A|nr:SRPBCC family protein [Catenuloplanes japonicus]